MASLSTHPRGHTQQWWSPDELADRWRVHVSTIYRQINDGSLKAMRLGGVWRLHRGVIQQREDAAKHKKVLKQLNEQRAIYRGEKVPDRIGAL